MFFPFWLSVYMQKNQCDPVISSGVMLHVIKEFWNLIAWDWAHPFLTTPTQILFNQLLISMNLYQYAFSLIFQEPDFSQIWDLSKNTANNIKFHYGPNSEKPYFRPTFGAEIFFSKNPALSRTRSHGPLTPCWVSEKTNEQILRKLPDIGTEGWKDRRSEGKTKGLKDWQPLIHLTFVVKARVQKRVFIAEINHMLQLNIAFGLTNISLKRKKMSLKMQLRIEFWQCLWRSSSARRSLENVKFKVKQANKESWLWNQSQNRTES